MSIILSILGIIIVLAVELYIYQLPEPQSWIATAFVLIILVIIFWIFGDGIENAISSLGIGGICTIIIGLILFFISKKFL